MRLRHWQHRGSQLTEGTVSQISPGHGHFTCEVRKSEFALITTPLHISQSDLQVSIFMSRFPIDENIDMKTRKVLTIDHVFSVLAAVARFEH